MTSYLPNAITASLSHGNDIVRSTIGSISWGPMLSISKFAAVSTFHKIEVGTLIISDKTDGKIHVFGQKLAKEDKLATNGVNGTYKIAGRPRKVELVVKKETFWLRSFLFADMGFAEAYMLGEVECDDLAGFFQVGFPQIGSRMRQLMIYSSSSYRIEIKWATLLP